MCVSGLIWPPLDSGPARAPSLWVRGAMLNTSSAPNQAIITTRFPEPCYVRQPSPKLSRDCMTSRTRVPAVVGAVWLAILMCACDGDGARATSPTPQPPLTPPTPVSGTTYTLSGVVFEAGSDGNVAVANVEVYCDSCGVPDGHTFRQTDGNGAYSFDGVSNGRTLLLVSKPGYKLSRPDETGVSGGINATVEGDTRFDIELVRQ